MIGQIGNPQLEAGGPTLHWIRPDMLVELTVEGRNFNALADSGSQVNMITPALVQQYGFPVLLLEDLVDYLLKFIGLGHLACGVLQDMTKMWCSWWCPMILILNEGSLWLW